MNNLSTVNTTRSNDIIKIERRPYCVLFSNHYKFIAVK